MIIRLGNIAGFIRKRYWPALDKKYIGSCEVKSSTNTYNLDFYIHKIGNELIIYYRIGENSYSVYDYRLDANYREHITDKSDGTPIWDIFLKIAERYYDN